MIVIAAYGLSLGAWPFMLMGAFSFLFWEDGVLIRVVPLIWIGAWVAHVRMSLAWIRNLSLSRRWPLWGTVAGVLSLLSPLLTVPGAQKGMVGHYVESSLITSAVVSVFLLPCIMLAVYLVRFHLHAAAITAGPIAPSPNPRQD